MVQLLKTRLTTKKYKDSFPKAGISKTCLPVCRYPVGAQQLNLPFFNCLHLA